MADTPPAAPPKASKGTFGFLTKRVFGKIPVWVIAVAGVGAYYWYTHYGPGKKTTATVTDPDGNTCSALNPATGYCPGTSGDAAALAAADAGGTSGQTDTSGAGASTGSGGGGTSGGGGDTGGATGGGSTPDVTGTPAPQPATTAAPPPPVVVPAAPPPAAHANAHAAHVAHVAHVAEEKSDAAQAAHAAHVAHVAHLAHAKKKGAKT